MLYRGELCACSYFECKAEGWHGQCLVLIWSGEGKMEN